MPDITMCSGANCKQREECYRYKAKPTDQWQSYFTDPPCNTEDDTCKYFWTIEEDKHEPL